MSSVFVLDCNNFGSFLENAKNSQEDFYVEVTLQTLLRLYKEQKIVDYENNRSGNFSKKRCKDIAENFATGSFGQVTCAFHKTKLELVDAHHRMGSLVVLNDVFMGFTAEVSSYNVILKIVPANMRIETYQRLNDQKKHSGNDKVNNPDLAVGSYVKEMLVAAGAQDLNKGLSQNLMDITLSYEENGTKFSLLDIYGMRTTVSKALNEAADRRSFRLEDTTINKVVNSLRKYNSLRYFAKSNKDCKTEVVSLIDSPGFFMTFLVDHVTDGKAVTGFSRQPNADIFKLVSGRKFGDIKNHTATVSRRSKPNIDLDSLFKALKNNDKSKKN